MFNIVLLGLPGAGKGTQSKKLKNGHKVLHIAPGDLFRSAIEENNSLGKLAKSYVLKGLLVPDEVVVDLVGCHLDKYFREDKGLIFDGYPRRIMQAKALDQQLAKYSRKLDAAFLLDASEEEVKKRINRRSKVEHREDDASITKVLERISNYKKDTLPVLQHYIKQNRAHKISALGEVEHVYQNLMAKILPFLTRR